MRWGRRRIQRESWSALDNRTHPRPRVRAGSARLRLKPFLTRTHLRLLLPRSSFSPPFPFQHLSVQQLMLGKVLHRRYQIRLVLRPQMHFRLSNASNFASNVEPRGRLRRMSVGGGFFQTVLAHLEWKVMRKCLLISVPAAQKPTKDHVAGCKHTTVSRRLCDLQCVFTRSSAFCCAQ